MLVITGDRVPDVRKIAVLRANRLGDFIVTLPALAALRAAYPGAELVQLGRPWHADFLATRRELVDRALAIPPCRGVGEPENFATDEAALGRFFAAMAAERFDLALQLHGGGGYSNPFVRRLGARVTAGLRAPGAPPLDRWVRYAPDQHEVLRFLEAVALVGAAPVALEPRLRPSAADRAEADRALPPDGQALVALHPGALDPRRRWAPAGFAAVGDALAAAGARVALVGTAGERPLAAAVARAMAADAADLAGRLSLGGLAGLLARCRVVVGNDSGPLHLAGAVGAATVGIYWGHNLVHYGPLTRGRHRPCVSWRAACPACGRDLAAHDCGHPGAAVADVPPEAVIAAARELLAARLAVPWAHDAAADAGSLRPESR
jgi:ADP-heptose:LPS heptosyltransferase